MNAVLLAFSMLTRLPLHPRGEVTDRQLRMSVMFYPWVGLGIGLLLMAAAPFLRGIAVPGLGGVVAVAWLALITGGLHLDGLADWFDAVGGGRGDRARMLEIMKDPRIGAHGATALMLHLIAKCLLMNEALTSIAPLSLAAIPLCSRVAIVPLVTWFQPARDTGLAHAVHGGSAIAVTGGALVPVVVWIVATQQSSICWPLLSALITALMIGAWARLRIGGVTGDVYGAALELAELAAVIAMFAAA